MPDDTPTETARLATSDGLTLEAEVAVPDRPVAAVLLAHPHPQHGGSMRSLVTSELFSSLPGRGLAVLRFNFRGVGASEGTHGGGVAEQLDVVAGIDELAARVPDVPLVTAGWSFGADTTLAVLDERLRGWFAIAPPLRILAPGAYLAAHDPRPKVLAVPERDEFNPPDRCAGAVEGWTATDLRVVPGADHFLVGRTGVVADWLVAWATDLAGGAAA